MSGRGLGYKARLREIDAHYGRFLGGRPERRASCDDVPASPDEPQPIFVFEFAPRAAGGDWIYVTAGASHRPMRLADDHEHRFEFMLRTKLRRDELADSLAALACYPSEHDTFLAPGPTIIGGPGGLEGGVLADSPLTDILVARPHFFPPEFEAIEHSDGSRSYLLWFIPLYTAERLYAREYGMWTLFTLFGENDTDTSDLWRAPVVRAA